jgi:hypothetical protein
MWSFLSTHHVLFRNGGLAFVQLLACPSIRVPLLTMLALVSSTSDTRGGPLTQCPSAPSQEVAAPTDEQQIALNVQALKNRLKGRGGRRVPSGRINRTDSGGSGRESAAASE